MTSHSHTTTNHSEIRRWAESHNAKPARIRGTANDTDDAGLLRIAFSGHDEALEVIEWDDWFDKFDCANLALLYQTEKASGEDSTFFKLVNR